MNSARLARLPRGARALQKACASQQGLRRSLATVQQNTPLDTSKLDQISTLSNGVRVATEALPGPFSGVGVYLDAGSRYENDALRGVSHIVDRLAFKSTTKRNSDQMIESMETLGGNIQCASSRETLMYQAATFNSAVPTAVELLAETVQDPLITDEEVDQQLATAEYEINEIWAKPELILPELIHVAAYKGNTLGNPLLCPRERLGHINKSTVDLYRQTFFRPERVVVAYVGVKHEDAVRLTEQHFGGMKGLEAGGALNSIADSVSTPSIPQSYSSPSSDSSPGILSKVPFFKNISSSAAQNLAAATPGTEGLTNDLTAAAQYTGGFLSLPPLPPPANPALPRLSYIHLAFEALPISSKDIYALATLQTLLGGGGSFSAGGPGKGMYSRLYTNVLNQHGWVESCTAFNHSYTDSGLFGISASCIPSKTSQMLEVMCKELHALTIDHGFAALKELEVNRAKNQLRSSLLMNLESRMVELEDLGRQVQVHGSKVGVQEMCKIIDELTVHDLRRVAREVVQGLVQNPGQGSGAPTVVLQEGEEENRVLNPLQWNEIQERIARWSLGRR